MQFFFLWYEDHLIPLSVSITDCRLRIKLLQPFVETILWLHRLTLSCLCLLHYSIEKNPQIQLDMFDIFGNSGIFTRLQNKLMWCGFEWCLTAGQCSCDGFIYLRFDKKIYGLPFWKVHLAVCCSSTPPSSSLPPSSSSPLQACCNKMIIFSPLWLLVKKKLYLKIVQQCTYLLCKDTKN